MDSEVIVPGDIVYAATDLTNDGTHPEFGADAVLAPAGAKGIVTKTGYVGEDCRFELLLVRLERPDGELGPPIGCWASELMRNERRVMPRPMSSSPLPCNDYAPGGFEYD